MKLSACASFAPLVRGFALGTLLYTVTALTVAPQVVMFVGLTHATVGLDQVRYVKGTNDDYVQPRVSLDARTTLVDDLLFLDGGIDIAQINGRVSRSSVKKVAEVVDQHPDESVQIIRGWLNNAL